MTVATETIIVKEVKPREAANRSAKAITVTGQWYDFWPDKVTVEANRSYDVEYSTRDWQGKTYRTIQKAIAHPAPVAQAIAGLVAKATNGYASDEGRLVPAHVSNWVAHAIQAGFISSPDQMVTWAQWAMEAARTMNKPPVFQGDPTDLPELRG